MSHSLSLSKMRYSHLKLIFSLICALIASNVWLITERSQLRNENDEFRTKLDQHDANFEGMKANFNVTEANDTDLKDSFDNAESDLEMDFQVLTKNLTSLRTEKLEMSNTIEKLKVG